MTDPRVGEIESRLSKAANMGEWSAKHPPSRDSWIAIEKPHGFTNVTAVVAKGLDHADAEFIANAPADVAYLLAELRKAHEALARVEALHKPVKKWEPYAEAGYSFNTREEALQATEDLDLNVVAIEAGPQYFEVCAECGRVESDQLSEMGEEWGYRESLWPCPTAAAVAAANGDGNG